MENIMFNVSINYEQFIGIFKKLGKDEKTIIFDKIREDILLYMFETNLFKPMSIEEYNYKLELAEDDIENNRIIKHQTLKKEFEEWMNLKEK